MKCILTEVCLVSAAFQSSGDLPGRADPRPIFLSLALFFGRLKPFPTRLVFTFPSLFLPLSLCQSQLQAEELSFVNNSQVD